MAKPRALSAKTKLSLLLSEDEAYAMREALWLSVMHPADVSEAELFECLEPVIEQIERKAADKGWRF